MLQPLIESPTVALTKMREIVAAGDPGSCGPGCLEDAMAQVLFGRSFWVDPDEADEAGITPDNHDCFLAAMAELPLYRQLLTRGKALFPSTEHCAHLWAINDRINRTQRLQIIDSVLAELA